MDDNVSKFWTPTQQKMMSIYSAVFEPVNRALVWLHARFTSGTDVFKDLR